MNMSCSNQQVPLSEAGLNTEESSHFLEECATHTPPPLPPVGTGASLVASSAASTMPPLPVAAAGNINSLARHLTPFEDSGGTVNMSEANSLTHAPPHSNSFRSPLDVAATNMKLPAPLPGDIAAGAASSRMSSNVSLQSALSSTDNMNNREIFGMMPPAPPQRRTSFLSGVSRNISNAGGTQQGTHFLDQHGSEGRDVLLSRANSSINNLEDWAQFQRRNNSQNSISSVGVDYSSPFYQQQGDGTQSSQVTISEERSFSNNTSFDPAERNLMMMMMKHRSNANEQTSDQRRVIENELQMLSRMSEDLLEQQRMLVALQNRQQAGFRQQQMSLLQSTGDPSQNPSVDVRRHLLARQQQHARNNSTTLGTQQRQEHAVDGLRSLNESNITNMFLDNDTTAARRDWRSHHSSTF